VHASGGFRNVVVNVRFDTAEARRLGVDGHVCELQLNLASFVACMTPQAHLRYLVLRNCRQDLPVAFTIASSLCSTVATALYTAAVAAAAVMAVRRRPALRKTSGSAGPMSRAKST